MQLIFELAQWHSYPWQAGAGNFSRAVGKGLGNPCFRIIQTHQAVAGNVGDIAAKEEVGRCLSRAMLSVCLTCCSVAHSKGRKRWSSLLSPACKFTGQSLTLSL